MVLGVSKEDNRVEAYGTVDEANSIIGLSEQKQNKFELILLDNISNNSKYTLWI